MAKNRLTFTIEPRQKGKRHLRFGDLIAELQAYHALLERTDRAVFERQTAVYEVVALSHSSPVMVTLEERPIDRKARADTNVIPHVINGLAMINDKGVQPDYFDRPILEKIKTISSASKKRGVITRVNFDNRTLTLGKAFDRKIDDLLQDEWNYLSTIEGRLDAINLHNNANVFYIYPSIGSKKIRCTFPKEKRDQAISALARLVSVRGRIFAHPKARFPHRIEVNDLRVLRDDEIYPSFYDIRGLSTNIEDDEPSEEIIGQIRDDWR